MSLPFRLRKSYADAIDPQGGWWIGYDATLEWGPLRANYREISSAESKSSHTTLSGRDVDGGNISVPRKATLRMLGGAVPNADLCLRHPALEWTLTHRRADVVVMSGGASRNMSAAGYGELVVLHRPPWELGIRDLYWGRYISAKHFLVWIVATGENLIGFGVMGDQTMPAGLLATSTFRVGEATISLGPVDTTILSGDAMGERGWPARALVRCLAPRFSVTQQKAVYSSVLRMPDGLTEEGKAIAEHVSFA